MVAVAADPRSGAAEQLQKAASPTIYELQKPGGPSTNGIRARHRMVAMTDVWSDDVSEYMRTAIPIIPNYILEGPPTMKRVTTALPKASKEELEAAFAASMMEYQAYNMALWDAIDSSILFNGAYEAVDHMQRKEFANGDLRDGVGLYNYVRDLTRRDPIEQQIEAMCVLATHGVLSADKTVTQVQFDRHVNRPRSGASPSGRASRSRATGAHATVNADDAGPVVGARRPTRAHYAAGWEHGTITGASDLKKRMTRYPSRRQSSPRASRTARPLRTASPQRLRRTRTWKV
jgi:hypothetical protein